MRPFFLLITSLFLSLSASAQIELNVKLRAGQAELQSYLAASANQRQIQAPSPGLQQAYPFLSALQRVQALKPARSGRSLSPEVSRVFTLNFPDSLSSMIAQLYQSGRFEWVEENRSIALHQVQADPPNDDSIQVQWYHEYIETFEAWEVTQGKKEVKVGIIDTGLDFGHPEFEGQVAINAAEDHNGNGRFEPWPVGMIRNGLNGDFDGIDNDGNGYTDDVVGYDFTDQPRSPFGGDYLDDDPDPTDDNNHGTLVAGVIHARADNGEGGAGLAPATQMVVLRAFSSFGQGEDDDIARAIIYAADNGVQILNMSFGDIYPSQTMHEAIKYAYSRGVIMVGSAGNGTGDELHYPSGFNEVISVSASTFDAGSGREFLWPLSSYGVTVDLCAPGAGIVTPTLLDTSATGEVTAYQRVQGTSFAAPMVSAAAALLISQRGPLTPQQVRGIVVASTDDISDAGWDHFTGAGRLNLRRALGNVGSSLVQISAPENDRGTAADSLYVLGTVLDPQFSSYHLEYQKGVEGDDEWISILADQQIQTKLDTLALWRLDTLEEGEYTLRLRVERSNGFPVEDRIRFVLDRSAPEIAIKLVRPIWDNEERKMLIIFRDADQGRHVLHYRRQGVGDYQQLPFDRITRNGHFLLDGHMLPGGTYEFFISGTNLAGLAGQTNPQTFSFSPAFVNRSGFRLLEPSLPMGRFLPDTYDFNQNGFPEVVMNEYNENLGFGGLKFFEYDGFDFQRRDSIDFREVLIPKDVADTDGDGLQELLCSANDSLYVLEQGSAQAFPKQNIYQDLGNGLFAAQWGDINDDGKLELLAKNFAHYYVFEGEGSSYQLADSLKDLTPGYIGSVAPRLLIGDFDEDNKTETIFGDFDGDFIVYEPSFNGSYEVSDFDTTSYTKSGPYLTQGDFDGDGQEEFFVAVHTSPLRNADFEYDLPHWWLRIFKGRGDNRLEVVWEDYLFDLDVESLNGATAGNLDQDPADELVFSTYPRTYIIEYDNGRYDMSWFLYGTLATHHLIADFNGNGVNELALGRGDTTFFWEKDFAYTGPQAVTSLDGIVLGPNKVLLDWPESAGAQEYEVFQVQVDSSRGPLFGGITDPRFLATQAMIPEQPYRFFVRSLAGNETSPFGNQIIRIPHPNNQLLDIEVINGRQLALQFSWPVAERERDKPFFVVNGEQSPIAITQTGDAGNRLILSFEKTFESGTNALLIDSLFLDADFGIFDPNSPLFTFEYQPEEEDFLYLTRWEATAAQEAELVFNYPLQADALEPANYEVAPFGQVVAVSWANSLQDAVRVQVEEVSLGSLGYPVSITVKPAVCAQNETCIRANEGNTATFSSFEPDLSEVYVYPNPVRFTPLFDGLRFANLTQLAQVRVFSASGRLVAELQETDGDGGLQWNMQDQGGKRIPPGVYLYYVTNADGQEFMGKFSVIE